MRQGSVDQVGEGGLDDGVAAVDDVGDHSGLGAVGEERMVPPDREQLIEAGPVAAGAGPALFLLGDLFEFWIGDDHPSEVATVLASELAGLAERGWRVFLMRGNRDFLIGEAYARRCRARLLDEPALLQIEGERVVLAHGDAECLDDTGYQQWRSLSHSAGWQQQFLARTIDERLAMARAARAASLANRRNQDTPQPRDDPRAEDDRPADDAGQRRVEGSGDLSPAAVTALLERFDAGGLIHGHTHRPALHALDAKRWRWVLPDWEVQPPRGEILSFADLRALRA